MTSKERRDVYQEVTDRIVASLENGTVPWRMPWTSTGGPQNLNGRPYRGINIFLLELMGFSDHRWGTFNMVKAHGGHVRKGEKATSIILWKPVVKNGKEADDPKERYLLLRFYSVFNAEQCEGLPEAEAEGSPFTPVERAEAVVTGWEMRPAIIPGKTFAGYIPARDVVFMPDNTDFVSPEAYYSTLFHELTHSTGHESRLKRIEPALYGSDPYAREELVAEIGAAMLCGVSGMDNVDQNASYVEGWLTALRNDKKLVVQAAAQAQKSSDLILGTTFEEEGAAAEAAPVTA